MWDYLSVFICAGDGHHVERSIRLLNQSYQSLLKLGGGGYVALNDSSTNRLKNLNLNHSSKEL